MGYLHAFAGHFVNFRWDVTRLSHGFQGREMKRGHDFTGLAGNDDWSMLVYGEGQ